MFAKIAAGRNIRNTLRYHEQKVQGEKATCLLAANFIKESHQLSRQDKLDRFLQRITLNERTEANILHVSLNFSAREHVTDCQMRVLSDRFMQSFGFDRQPYLVYRHNDRPHPHCHIIATTIQADGTTLHLTPADCRLAHRLARQWEVEFSLVRPAGLHLGGADTLRPAPAQRVQYDKTSLGPAISNVLKGVIDHYKYANLMELNAVLRLYNVRAVRGLENSYLYRHRGLLYQALDENGKQVGKSIKASYFIQQSTLSHLEKKYAHTELSQQEQQRVRTAIDWALAGQPPSWDEFREALEQERISVVVQDEQRDGHSGVFFIDHSGKGVHSGESLGNNYLLEAIQERCTQTEVQDQQEETLHHHHHLSLF